MIKPITVLDCFAGMGCSRIALDRLGIPVKEYYSSEVDPHAFKVMKANYPDVIQLGSIEGWESWDIPQPDLIVGGSPCQGFSRSGKGLNFDDPRSKLYFTFEAILKHYKPQWWLLENVDMLDEWRDTISRRLGIRPIKIDSALVSAQSRVRLYWTNINSRLDMFDYPYCDIGQPGDKKIKLVDILEDIPDCLTGFELREKSKTLRIGGVNSPIGSKQEWDSPFEILGGAIRGRYLINDIRQDSKMKTAGLTKQRVETRTDSKSNTVTTVEKDNILVLLHNQEIHTRRYSPVECEHLQTVPTNYTKVKGVSKTQRLKLLGNGMTVDVICWILSHIEELNQ